MLHLEVVQTGLLASTVGLTTVPMTRRYLSWEAEGIRKRAETTG